MKLAIVLITACLLIPGLTMAQECKKFEQKPESMYAHYEKIMNEHGSEPAEQWMIFMTNEWLARDIETRLISASKCKVEVYDETFGYCSLWDIKTTTRDIFLLIECEPTPEILAKGIICALYPELCPMQKI